MSDPTQSERPQSSPKTALIVGAKRVGQVVAHRLAEDGINLAIAYRSSVAEAQSLADSINNVDTALIKADLSDERQVIGAVKETVGALGGLDYVVNLASDYPYAPFDSLDGAAWDRAMASAKGSYLIGLHAAKQMRTKPRTQPRTHHHVRRLGCRRDSLTPITCPYLTAKASIHFMTRCLAAEVASFGVRVNAVAPGPTMRPPEITPEDWDRAIAAKAPLQLESSVNDIAEIIATLLRTSSITGEIVRVDSGRHIRGV